MIILGCACGGIIELLLFGIVLLSTSVSVWATKIYNDRMRRKCKCTKKSEVH